MGLLGGGWRGGIGVLVHELVAVQGASLGDRGG